MAKNPKIFGVAHMGPRVVFKAFFGSLSIFKKKKITIIKMYYMYTLDRITNMIWAHHDYSMICPVIATTFWSNQEFQLQIRFIVINNINGSREHWNSPVLGYILSNNLMNDIKIYMLTVKLKRQKTCIANWLHSMVHVPVPP